MLCYVNDISINILNKVVQWKAHFLVIQLIINLLVQAIVRIQISYIIPSCIKVSWEQIRFPFHSPLAKLFYLRELIPLVILVRVYKVMYENFTVALFVVAKHKTQPKCPSLGDTFEKQRKTQPVSSSCTIKKRLLFSVFNYGTVFKILKLKKQSTEFPSYYVYYIKIEYFCKDSQAVWVGQVMGERQPFVEQDYFNTLLVFGPQQRDS